MRKFYLMTPGPTPLPYYVREALAREIIHHRTKEFREILSCVHRDLKEVLFTKNPVIVFASSGTGAMEAAVVNFFSFRDKVLVVNGGKFGQRWAEIAKVYGLEVVEYKLEWGKAPSVEVIENILKENKDIRGILTTLCETSTGTVYDIEGIGRLTKDSDVLLVVDAISGWGQDKLFTDSWGVDIVVVGSQKGFMLPPGLSFISVSPKAKDALKRSNLPKYYFDIKKALKSYDKNDTPFTPSVSLIVALRDVLCKIKEEGVENRWRKFSLLASAVREGIKSLGLSLFSERPSNSVTAVNMPQGLKSTELVKLLREKYGLGIASGQEEYKDKIFRIAHMGAIEKEDILVCFSLLEEGLREVGYQDFVWGISLKKIQEVLNV